MTTYAHCDKSGVISFTSKPDEQGLLQIGFGEKGFRKRVETLARHGYRGHLLVPSVPEAASDNDKLIAIAYFRDWLSGMKFDELNKLHDIRGVQDRAMQKAFA